MRSGISSNVERTFGECQSGGGSAVWAADYGLGGGTPTMLQAVIGGNLIGPNGVKMGVGSKHNAR
jgi:hypothetical protein